LKQHQHYCSRRTPWWH